MFSRSGGHKTKETYPTRPGSPSPCKQGLKDQKATIFNLRETFSKPEDEKIWTAEWGGKGFFSHVTEHSKGVTMLINLTSKFQVSNVEIDPHGRYSITKLQVEHTIFYVINVYAPNDYREEEQFIRISGEKLVSKTDTTKLIISGDWNAIRNKIDKWGELPWKETTYRNSIIGLMEELDLLDIYRQFHVDTKPFTYETKNSKLKSRIDFFHVSRPTHIMLKEPRCALP